MSSENNDYNDVLQLEGADISNVLSSDGPVVKCVVLRANPENSSDADKKPSAKTGSENSERLVLADLIDEIEIDTTPSKSMAAKTLGGSFTFLGQYEDEGIVLMIRDIPEDTISFDKEELSLEKLSNLKNLCDEREIDTTGMLEKSDLINALVKDSELPPLNPHSLQPPLNKATVRGDILILKVAATNEELDEESGDEDSSEEESGEEAQTITVPTNDEFFLNYTKKQYMTFASRMDIKETDARPSSEDDSEEEGEKKEISDEENDGEAYELGRDDYIEDEDKSAMFNLVMNEVLRQYREEHGRGPHTHELLELRATIAKELDVEISEIEIVDWNKKAKADSKNSVRRITFHTEDRVREYHPDPDEHLHSDDEIFYGNNPDNDDDEEEEEYEPPKKKAKTQENETDGEEKNK